MIKHFCDHCGKEIVDKNEIYEIDARDFPYYEFDNVTQFFGKELCEVCRRRWLQWHSAVDEAFFHMVKED